MLKAWKEMEEKASQCAQVGDIKETLLSVCKGCDSNFNCCVLLCPFSLFDTLHAVRMRKSWLQMGALKRNSPQSQGCLDLLV